ncbi:MAG: hypothetical protein QXI67_06170 [Candidatus Bathyarchaeia archaeon]
MYLWNSLFDEKVEANADLNMRGIDRRVCVKDNIFNLQVKKLATGKRLEEEYLKVK